MAELLTIGEVSKRSGVASSALRFYEDLSEDQTAATLRCTTRAANSLVSRAMVTLRRELTEEEA